MWPQFAQFALLVAMIAIMAAGCGDDDPGKPSVTGTLVINPGPRELDAPWSVSVPGNSGVSGTGDSTLSEVSTGEYTITWGDIPGWTTPPSEMLMLVAGATSTFRCTYTEEPGTVSVDMTPDTFDAWWTLTGPGDYRENGNGDRTLPGLSPGEYTVTWGNAAGWLTPLEESQVLVGGTTVVFTGEYVPGPLGLLVLIPPVSVPLPVTFTMGSMVDSSETPHQVTLTGRFHMAKTEVTNSEYVLAVQWAYDRGYVTATSRDVWDHLDGSGQKLLDINHSYSQISFDDSTFSTSHADHPVVNVNWFGAAAYCDWLSLREGLPRTYDHSTWRWDVGAPYAATGYRLPTEAEWELACRAGTTTHFATGDCLDSATEANYCGRTPWLGCSAGPCVDQTASVASYSPNGWGLCDMHGNVMEWCNDWYGTYAGDETNPVGRNANGFKVLRGGGYNFSARSCRSARRSSDTPGMWESSYGFRPVRMSF